MKTQMKKAVTDVNDLLFKGKIKKVEYLAMNMFGWMRNESIAKCIDEMNTNHYGRAKWADPDKKKNMPYRIFMLLDTDSDYNTSPAIESLGISENGIPTLLVVDTYKD